MCNFWLESGIRRTKHRAFFIEHTVHSFTADAIMISVFEH